MRTTKDNWKITRRCMKPFFVTAVMALCLVSPGQLFSNPSTGTQSVSFHSALLKHSIWYLYIGRTTLTLHVHNETDRYITQATIDLIAYWPPEEGERAKKEIDFDDRYRLVSVKSGGIAPYSDGGLSVDWNSDIKAGTKDDPIVPTKVLHRDEPVYLYGDELGDRPNVQTWLRDEMVVWRGVSVTFSLMAPVRRSQNATQATPWKDLLTPLPDGQRPDGLSYKIGSFDVWNVGSYGIRMEKDDGALGGDKLYYDPVHHYYLEVEWDSPGAPSAETRRLLLLPEAEWKASIDDPEYSPPTSPIRRRLLSLVTETNVRIGDSIFVVARKLGRPSYPDQGMLHYSYPGGHLNGWSYESWYEFDNNRLVGISITIQKGPEVAG